MSSLITGVLSERWNSSSKSILPLALKSNAEALIGLIRHEAHAVVNRATTPSGQSAPDGRFDDEYAAALLFLILL